MNDTSHNSFEHLSHEEDSLTGLLSRRALKPIATNLIERSDILSFNIIFIDLDKFKFINDTKGHNFGDLVLANFSNRLKKIFPTSPIFRMGGDEFLILSMASAPIYDFYKELSNTMIIDGQEVSISASIGVSQFPRDGDNIESLICKSDYAMYDAKINKKNVSTFSSNHLASMRRERLVRSNIDQAIEAGEIEPWYQPIHGSNSENIIGFEALARWYHPEIGYVPPQEFVAAAEANGLIQRLGMAILSQAIRDFKHWKQKFSFEGRVSVNVSPLQILDPSFLDDLFSVIEKNSICPKHIAIEVTESRLISQVEEASKVISVIKSQGVEVYLDDFGTGFSSLSLLQKIDFDKIKIDRSFISQISRYGGNLRMIQSIILMARSLGLSVVAEGIEEKWQYSMLRPFLCSGFQGYFFSPPIPRNELNTGEYFLMQNHSVF